MENNPLQNILGLNAINTGKKTKKLMMTINTTIFNEIWKVQNQFKHETKRIPTENILTNIKNNLNEIIMVHYKKHEQNNSLLKFQDRFAIENSLCTIENDSIIFNF